VAPGCAVGSLRVGNAILWQKSCYYETNVVWRVFLDVQSEARTKKGKISEKVIANQGLDDYYDIFGNKIDGSHSVRHTYKGARNDFS